MENKESLEAISLSCRKILKLLSGFLLLQKDQQKGKDRRVSAILNLMYRMTCNILTVLMMSNWSQKRNNTVFLKLPMGVLLRTVFTESLHAKMCQGTGPDTRTTMGKKGSPIGLKSC